MARVDIDSGDLTWVRLGPGDWVLLPTDGVVGESLAGGRHFGEAGLREMLQTTTAEGLPASESVRCLSRALMAACRGRTADGRRPSPLKEKGRRPTTRCSRRSPSPCPRPAAAEAGAYPAGRPASRPWSLARVVGGVLAHRDVGPVGRLHEQLNRHRLWRPCRPGCTALTAGAAYVATEARGRLTEEVGYAASVDARMGVHCPQAGDRSRRAPDRRAAPAPTCPVAAWPNRPSCGRTRRRRLLPPPRSARCSTTIRSATGRNCVC